MQITDFWQIIQSPTLAYEEGLNFFEGRGMLNETLRRSTDELEKNGIDYAVVRAIALNQHGYQRFTVVIKGLDASFVDRLHPYVKEKFLELHRGVMQSREIE
jgi:hypothetical protein